MTREFRERLLNTANNIKLAKEVIFILKNIETDDERYKKNINSKIDGFEALLFDLIND